MGGFGNQPQSKAVRITVVGHASTRWLGAKSRAEAERLNKALSDQRAENVRATVERILKQCDADSHPGSSRRAGGKWVPSALRLAQKGLLFCTSVLGRLCLLPGWQPPAL